MVTSNKKHQPSKFARFLLYPAAFVVFIFILSVVLLLANGYSLGFKNGHLLVGKTGMLIIGTKPSNAEIYLNNKKNHRKTSFSFLPAKLPGLLPGEYSLTIKKEGFRNWSKVILINPSLVTWENYVLLFPLDLKITKVDLLAGKTVIGSSPNRYLLVSSVENNQQILSIYDEQSTTLKKVWPSTYTPTEPYLVNPQIEEAVFNSGNNKIRLKIKNGGKSEFAVLDYSGNEQKIYSLNANYKANILKVIWNPQDENEIFYLADNALNRVNINSGTPQLVSQSVADFAIDKNSLYLIKNEGQEYALYKSGFDGVRQEELVKSLVKSDSYKIVSSSSSEFLAVLPSSGKTLSVYRKVGNQFTTIDLAKNVKDFKWSNDKPFVMYYDDNNIYRYDFEKQVEAKFAVAGIKKADWFVDDYHFLVNANELYACDFDGTNQVSLEKNTVKDFYLDQKLTTVIFEHMGNVSDFSKYIASF